MTLGPERVLPLLRGAFGRTGYLHEVACPSTQRLPADDAPHGTVAVAEHQTEGRGRLGRSWIDEPGTGLLFSVVLRPTRPPREWPTLTAVVGEAAADGLEAAAGVRATVKPPNDLLIEGRKVAGILAEAQGDRIVVGIGVNVGAVPFAGAAALDPGTDRAALLAELLLRLERAFDAWDALRPARPGDAELVLEIFGAARAAQELPFPVGPRDRRAFARRVLGLETWISADRGFLALSDDLLECLYVHPAAQGRGIGSALLALAKQRRPDGFRLWVFQRLERTRRFYERHGCTLVELGDGSGSMEGLPDALYAWRPPGG